MNYGTIRERSLQLIAQYSIAGEPVSPAYNHQQDSLLKIPPLVNDALIYLATAVKKLPAAADYVLKQQRTEEGLYVLPLPGDFYRLGGFTLLHDGAAEDVSGLFFSGGAVYAPKALSGTLRMDYYRYPSLLSDTPDDSAEPDAAPEVLAAIPYYVAAHLVMYDDPGARDALLGEFETRISRIAESRFVCQHITENCCGLLAGGDGA